MNRPYDEDPWFWSVKDIQSGHVNALISITDTMKKYRMYSLSRLRVLCRAITEQRFSDAVAVHERPEMAGPSTGTLHLRSSPIPLRGGILHAYMV
jgi:hypothetical protein